MNQQARIRLAAIGATFVGVLALTSAPTAGACGSPGTECPDFEGCAISPTVTTCVGISYAHYCAGVCQQTQGCIWQSFSGNSCQSGVSPCAELNTVKITCNCRYETPDHG
jgi:hypothetical protein